MKKESIVQLKKRMDAIIKSENVNKDELLKISLELDMLIIEKLNKLAM